MTIPSKQIGGSAEYNILHTIAKLIERLIKTTSSGGITNNSNITEIGGNTVDSNTGNAGDGTLRVVLASDQPNIGVIDQIQAVKLAQTLTRPSDNNNYTAGDAVANSVLSPTTINFTGAARANGKGGYLNEIKIETDATQFASTTLRLWLFNDVPASIVGDNVAFVNNFANASKRMCYVDVTLDALLAGSDTVFGKSQPFYTYICDSDDTTIYMLIQTLSAITAPKSGGSFRFCLNTVQL